MESRKKSKITRAKMTQHGRRSKKATGLYYGMEKFATAAEVVERPTNGLR